MKRYYIVQLSGKQGSGKSSTLKALTEMIRAEKPVFYTNYVKFADIIYEMHDAAMTVAAKYGIPLNKDKYTGKVKEGAVLQYLGTEFGRVMKGADVWVNATKKKVLDEVIRTTSRNGVVFLNDDTRFENEFHAFDSLDNCVVLKVRLEALEDVRRERCTQWREDTGHVSETGLDKYAEQGLFDLTFRTDLMDTKQVTEKIYKALFLGAF